MLIGIDGNEANVESKVGVHQMAHEILWGLRKLQDTTKHGHRYVVYLKNPPNKDLPKENTQWKYKILPGGRVWILTKLLPELIKGRKPDVFLALSHYLPPLSVVPMVNVITDLGYLEFTGQFRKYDYWQLKYWTAISVIVSKYIISISDSTKKDIVRHYPNASAKVKTVHLGSDLKNYNQKISQKLVGQIAKKYRVSSDYIVFMSLLKPSKNIEGLIDAFSMLKKKYPYQLVISGKKGWLFDTIFQKVKDLGLKKDVIFTGYLSDKERGALLKGAKVFVLPSFWEGFGIDVLNAFSCGVPAVISTAASLPEVGGKAGIYVDPNNPKDIAEKIEKVINLSPKEYNKQVQLGYDQLKKFSWDKTARGIMSVLEKAAQA